MIYVYIYGITPLGDLLSRLTSCYKCWDDPPAELSPLSGLGADEKAWQIIVGGLLSHPFDAKYSMLIFRMISGAIISPSFSFPRGTYSRFKCGVQLGLHPMSTLQRGTDENRKKIHQLYLQRIKLQSASWSKLLKKYESNRVDTGWYGLMW